MAEVTCSLTQEQADLPCDPSTTTTTTTTTSEGEAPEVTKLSCDGDTHTYRQTGPTPALSLSPARPSTSPDLPIERERESDRGFMGESVGHLVSSEMEEEESKLEEANREEEEKLRSTVREREKENSQEQRYKRLMHLLTKSQFYSEFLLQQIETQKHLNSISVKSTQSENDGSSQSDLSSQDSQGSGSGKRKRRGGRGGGGGGRGGGGKRRKGESSYQITDVIDEDVVKRHAEGEKNKEEEIARVCQPKLFKNGTLRDYQLDGFSWLLTLYENGINGILGDEMGLGKTVQFIALICHLVEQGVAGPFLVCAPLSTLPNWMAEFERFAPAIPTLLYHGPEKERAEKRRLIRKAVEVEGCPVRVMPVVVTSYEVIIRDVRALQQQNWRYLCVDEGHRLKNHKCRLTKSLNAFPPMNRLLLTGTPLQNSLAELWALLNFLMQDIFDSLDVFESWFSVTEMLEEGSDQKILQQEKEGQVISTLMKILSPFFLRRVKKDISLDIPPKRELLVYTPMTPQQLRLYTATLTSNMDAFAIKKREEEVEYDDKGRPVRKAKSSAKVFLQEEEEEEEEEEEGWRKEEEEEERLRHFFRARGKREEGEKCESPPVFHVQVKLQNKMMQLRRIVNHPYLVEYPLNPDGTFRVTEEVVGCCGKLQVLDQLLKELYHRHHRVLLFSQMTSLLDILEDYLSLRPQFRYRRLDGQRKVEDRQKDIQDFNVKDSRDFLFLLSTRAGGLGVNLASADTVIIYDSDWNPQCDLQAQDRCHRIGQTSPVLVLRLITAASVDERIVERATTKRKLERLIIQSGKFQAASQRERRFGRVVDEEELLALLNHRDHHREHRASQGHVFTKEELDQLLDRSDLIKKKKRKEEEEEEEEERELTGVFKVISEED